ncbi:MAG: ABC transporter permease [Verrucomicrobiales bacterium]|nr:ABC transporter permease [Verrucomicrobiales bacterium]
MRAPIHITRLLAMVGKEFVQMRRDRLTFAMMAGIPMMQLLLFGFAINQDPKHLPMGVVNGDSGPLTRAMVAGMQVSDYFRVVDADLSASEATEQLARGELQFVLHVPPDFERDVRRGRHPALLVEADASDPSATSRGLSALSEIGRRAAREVLKGPAAPLQQTAPPFSVTVHALYNPEAHTAYNIVPGLMGVILTMTMVMITALAMTRERERGTLEMLLSTPVRPLEVLVGKIVPYIVVAYIQIGLILVAARLIFKVPFEGSLPLLLGAALVFVLANLGVGVTFSTIARNQLQAVQMAFFFFLPSILLSGFMFPFRGMPDWAQAIGSVLPITHFLRVVRGIMLKGAGWLEVAPEVAKMALFLVGSLTAAVARYRRTLD